MSTWFSTFSSPNNIQNASVILKEITKIRQNQCFWTRIGILHWLLSGGMTDYSYLYGCKMANKTVFLSSLLKNI